MSAARHVRAIGASRLCGEGEKEPKSNAASVRAQSWTHVPTVPGPEAGPCKNNTSLTSEPPLAHFPAMCKVTGTGWCAARGVQEGGIPETGIAPNPAKRLVLLSPQDAGRL